jgi:hypothetical protein
MFYFAYMYITSIKKANIHYIQALLVGSKYLKIKRDMKYTHIC